MSAAVAVAAALRSTGLPFTHRAWPTGKAPALPWCVWLEDGHGETFADDTNYAELPRMRVELYQKNFDQQVLGSVRDALGAVRSALRAIAPTSERTDWVESEGCWMTAFELTYTGV